MFVIKSSLTVIYYWNDVILSDRNNNCADEHFYSQTVNYAPGRQTEYKTTFLFMFWSIDHELAPLCFLKRLAGLCVRLTYRASAVDRAGAALAAMLFQQRLPT